MVKKLTLAEAWLELAEDWSEPFTVVTGGRWCSRSKDSGLTLAEAWLELADAWGDPIMDDFGYWKSRKGNSGICNGIIDLRFRGVIDDTQVKKMGAAVARLPDYGLGGYKWGHTREDARLREQFCREQALLAGAEVTDTPMR